MSATSKSAFVIAILGAGILLGPAARAAESSPPKCLSTQDIQTTSIKDNQTIVFHLSDGTTWENHLASRCPGLKIANGFSYDATPNATICANLQSIRVVNQPTICLLGEFARPASADKPGK